MSYQQQGFADPVTPSQERRPINTDPREQPGYQPQSMNTDPREQPQWPGGQPPFMARPPQRGRSPWFWAGISVVILVSSSAGYLPPAFADHNGHRNQELFGRRAANPRRE